MSLAQVHGRSSSRVLGVVTGAVVVALVLTDPGMWPLLVIGVPACGTVFRSSVCPAALPGGVAAGLFGVTVAVGLSGLTAAATRSEHAVIALVLLGATLALVQLHLDPASVSGQASSPAFLAAQGGSVLGLVSGGAAVLALTSLLVGLSLLIALVPLMAPAARRSGTGRGLRQPWGSP
jgi:hypothetical protein